MISETESQSLTRVCRRCSRELPLAYYNLCGGYRLWKCRDCRTEAARQYCAVHRDEIRRKRHLHYLATIEASRAHRNAYARRWYQVLRMEVLRHYGQLCACCGETESAFLCVDHINGGGTKHLKSLAAQGQRFYEWLRREGWPSGFQILCHNCNAAKGSQGICPHQRQAGIKELQVLSSAP